MTPLYVAIAEAAIAAVDLAVERWREGAAFRAAKLLALVELSDAERRRRGKKPRPQLLRRWRARRALAVARAHERVTQHQCDCLEAEVARRVAAAVEALTVE